MREAPAAPGCLGEDVRVEATSGRFLSAAASGAADTTSPWQTVLISAGVTLVVGILSVLGAYLLERFKRRGTDRRWLLDRRHESYVAFIQAADDWDEALREAASRATPADDEPRRRALTSFYSVLLTGTDQAQWLAAQVVDALRESQGALVRGEEFERVIEQVTASVVELLSYLRLEMQPGRRWPWTWGRSAESRANASFTPPDQPRPRR